ncbi:DUF1631 family protein [Variovorax terrae]|uniref:DUF1631 domain-containing protein n=1 Tax=Variovorax terrae TaxID=2923278 RepID=A0A9X2APR8_9BURK|nr:DUF1631 family protein [Variovorax terrae]MCJ0762336.1 DUF1631 domain-containing protein [Variovorax terrae]
MAIQDPHQMQQHAALYESCVSEAARRGKPLMHKLVDSTRLALHQRTGRVSDPHELSPVMESLRLLNKHEAMLVERYPEALKAAFAEAVSSGAARPAHTEAPSFDELELMDEAQVQESVELARAQQLALLASDAQLTELNALICAAQGLKTVQPDRNPLRPDVYVRTLLAVLKQTEVAASVRLRWMQYMGETLGQELADTYSELSIQLRSHRVVAAAYTVTQTAPPGSPAASRPPAAARSRDDVLLTVDQLRRLLAGELDGAQEPFAAQFAREFEGAGREAAVRPEFSPTVPAAFEALQEMKQVETVMQRLAVRNKAAEPARVPGTASAAAPSLGQSLGQEVVNLMVDNIAHDPRLLAPVQQVVRSLEPALLKLALIDPRFFSDKRHPARHLLEQVTQRSLAWGRVDAPGFSAFMEPLLQAVDALVEMPIGGAEPFSFALKSLEEAWDEQQGHERRQRDKAMQALMQAEQRNLLAEKLAAELRNRPDLLQAPAPMAAFLCGPWTQVMAQAKLADAGASADPGGYAGIINDLLWSAQPQLAHQHLARLTRLIPPLLDKLREGLRSIDYPRPLTHAFFETLMALHQQALKPTATPAAPPAAASTREELEARFSRTDGAIPWIAPTEAQHSGFMDTEEPPSTRPPFAATQPAFTAALLQPAPASRAAGIPLGAWVELLVQDRWVRTQLTWASPHGTLFMFTSVDGGTHSMTRRSLDTLLAEGRLQVVSGQAVVDGALDAVAQTAMRNSLDVML